MPSDNQEPVSNKEPQVDWNALNFKGKEFTTLKQNDLYLEKTAWSPQRLLASLNPERWESTIDLMVDKFAEVESRVAELEKEWSETADSERIKLEGKMCRLKEYLLKVTAIGNFTPLFENLEQKLAEITQRLEENLKVRQAIVAKAESLADSTEWKETTEAYKVLMETWKQAPFVIKEKGDELWQRLEEARNRFYEAKRKHHEEQSADFMQNLDLKVELCEKAEALKDSSEWKDTTEAFKQLMNRWKEIGRVASAEKNEELWNRFNAAKNHFYDRKQANYEEVKAEQEENLKLKNALVEKAEALKDSTAWKETAAALNELMEEWKKIGRVPLEYAEDVWQKFITAKDHFFNNKKAHYESLKAGLEDNYIRKQTLVKRAEALKNSVDWKEATEEMNELFAEWKSIGPVPREYGDSLWETFIAARHYFFDRKDKDRDKRRARFQQQLQQRILQSREFLEKLYHELEDDEAQLKEFAESLAQEEGGPKSEEIKSNLKRLISQIERRIPLKQTKIEEVKLQITELEDRMANIRQSHKDDAPAAGVKASGEAVTKPAADEDGHPDA